MQEFQEKMIDKFIDCIDKLNYGILWPEPRLSWCLFLIYIDIFID